MEHIFIISLQCFFSISGPRRQPQDLIRQIPAPASATARAPAALALAPAPASYPDPTLAPAPALVCAPVEDDGGEN